MFSLHKYLDKIYQIKWFMTEEQKNTLENNLFVVFECENDHFIIKEIHYTYMDILLGLEKIDFYLEKVGDNLCMNILNV